MKKFLKKIAVSVLTLCAATLVGLGVNTVQKVEKANAANVNTTVTEDNFLVYSAALRMVEYEYTPAVRYRIAMDKTTFENNYGANGVIDQNLTTGILLAKKSVLGNNTLTMSNAGASAETTTWWKEDVCLMDKDGDGVKEEVACMVSSMFVYNIPESDFGVNLVARAYITYNGVTTYSKQTGGVSLSWVALQTYAEADGSVDVGTLTEQEKSVRDTYCKYTLNYYVDNVVSSTGSAYYGEKLTQPATPTSKVDTGEFLGWYNRTGTVKWEFATQTALGTTNLYAKFGLANPYTVTLSVNGTDAYLPLEYKTATGYETEYKGVAIALPEPERYGYRFEGWNTAENGTGTMVNSATYTCAGNTTLYAQWSDVCYLWLYYGERSTDYVRLEYKVGDSVSVSELNAVLAKVEKEKNIKILTHETTHLGLPYTATVEYWAYEKDTVNDTYEKIVSDVTFYGEKSEAIVIARYDDYLEHLEYTQESKEDFLADGDFDTAPSYITTGKVEHVLIDKDAVAGNYSMTFSWVKGQVVDGSFGPAFRMDPITHDYQYETKGESYSNYLSVVVGPATGNTGIYRVVEGQWSRIVSDIAVSGDWKTYYTSVQTGATVSLTMEINVRTNGFDVVYNFDGKTQSIYSTTMDLTPYLGTGFGLRSSSTGVTVSNVTYEPSYVKVVQFYSEGQLLSTQYTAANGSTVAFPSNPTKTGYTKYNGNEVTYEFVGWYTENNEHVTSTRKFVRDTKVTARFKPVERRNGFLVNYDSQGDVVYTVDANRAADSKEGITFDGYGLPLTTAGNEVSYKLTVPALNKNAAQCNIRFTFFIDDIETSGNKSLDIDGENGQNTVWVNLALTSGTLILGSKINGSSRNNFQIQYSATSGNYVWADRTTGNADASKNNKFLEYYANIFAAGTSEAVFDVKAKYGIDANGYGWIKFYMFDQLIFTYGLAQDATAGYVGGEKVWGRICTDANHTTNIPANSTKTSDEEYQIFKNYMQGKALGTEVGIWSWGSEMLHGGYSVSDIYATRIKNGVTVTKDALGNSVWNVTGDRSVSQGTIIGDVGANGVFEHRISFTDLPAQVGEMNYRTLFFAEEGTSASFTGNGTQASLWVNFHVGHGTLIFGSKINGVSRNNFGLNFNNINPESTFKKYYKAKYDAALATDTPVPAAFDIKVMYGLDENGCAWMKYYMKGATDSVYSLLFTYGLSKDDLNGEVCHGMMCTDVNYSVDNSVFLSYVKSKKMGTKVGFSSWAGTPNMEYTVSNVSITELKTQDNGFTVRKDGSYVSNVYGTTVGTGTAGVTTVDTVKATKYGLWETDVTMNRATIGARLGLFISAYVPNTDGYLAWTDNRVNGYLLYYNPNANQDIGFAKIIDGGWDRWASTAYANNGFTLSNTNAAYAEVKEYYEAVNAVKNGDKKTVTVHLGFEYTPTALRIYVGGKLFAENTTETELHHFDNNADCYQVGFLAGTEGVVFSNYQFTGFDNGYRVRSDGTYVTESTISPGLSVTTVDSVQTTRYGLWEADVTMDKTAIKSGYTGLLISAYVPNSGTVEGWQNDYVKGYYFHHNASANQNFQIVYLQKEGSSYFHRIGNVFQYATSTAVTGGYNNFAFTYADKENDAYAVLKQYWADNAAVQNGTKETVTVRMGIEFTPNAINVYLGGCLFATVTENLDLFNSDDTCIQVGFASGGIGTVFSNYKFTPYVAA